MEHILEFYGATEGAGGLFNVDEVPGMIGRILNPGAAIIIKVDEETGEFYIDENGFLIECKIGESGMFFYKIDPNVSFLGYKDKEKTGKKVLHNVLRKGDKYFNTGDMVNIYKHYYLSFADRYGDTFRWKGENVSTLEVESILNTYPQIEVCTVYGNQVPHPKG
ncbi:MAG: long-chain-acyl-CoA synthetase, partial [Candidatus Thorarchaeota archaeon]